MGQDTNAANEGDILKHALLLEVLNRCQHWPTLSYSETHAGAGVYDSGLQEKKHIESLKQRVESTAAPKSGAGKLYYDGLSKWWSDPNNASMYPGSVLQAVRHLSSLNKLEAGHIRVTEAVNASCSSLERALQRFSVRPKLAPFQDSLNWLTEYDHLVLLVDPFGMTRSTGPELTKALNRGFVDLAILKDLFSSCWPKNAVVMFWSAFAHEPGAANKRGLANWLSDEVPQRGADHRWFVRRHYNVALVGIGKGRDVVAQVPGNREWGTSWLAKYVREA